MNISGEQTGWFQWPFQYLLANLITVLCYKVQWLSAVGVKLSKGFGVYKRELEGTVHKSINTKTRPIGRGGGGSRELVQTPPLTSKRFYIHRLNVYILSMLVFESGPLVSLQLRITTVQMGLVSSMRVCSWRTSKEHVQNKVFNTFTSFDAPSHDVFGWSMQCTCVV